MELNGAPVSAEQLEALALVNYGHFTSMLVEDGRVRGLPLHLRRLVRDGRRLFDVELDTDRVRELVRSALAGAAGPVVVRVTIFDAGLGMGAIGAEAQPDVLVTTRAAEAARPEPWRLRSVRYRREDPEVKHVGLFGAMRHRRAAQREGFDDALFLDADGAISEIATSNIGFVRGDRIVWPSSEQLAGVTMALFRREQGDSSVAERVELADLSAMDAAFTANAAVGVRPVAAVDGVAFPAEHRVLDELRARYAAIPGEAL